MPEGPKVGECREENQVEPPSAGSIYVILVCGYEMVVYRAERVMKRVT